MPKPWKWTTPEEARRDEAAYWISRPVSERLAAVETLRQLTWGIYGDATARMERVHRLVVRRTRPVSHRGRARAKIGWI
jgi:hypothetical protein